MVDMSDNPNVTRLIGILQRKDATIASLCHGPAILLAAPANTDGQWVFDGYRMTAFTDDASFESDSGGGSVRLKKRLRWNADAALPVTG